MGDLRDAVRGLLRTRWVTIGAVLTFALGIGVNVAVFSAVDRLLVRDLPYADPDRLFILREFNRSTGQVYGTLPALYVLEARRRVSAIAGMADGDIFPTSLTTTAEPEGEPPLMLAPRSFETLALVGVAPVRGRDFNEDDARARRALVLLAYETWQQRFGASEDVIGRSLWRGKERVEIVGVLPPGFVPPGQNLVPDFDGLVLESRSAAPVTPKDRLMAPLVRLRPDVSVAAVEAELTAIFTEVSKQLPAPPPDTIAPPLGLRLQPVDEAMLGYYRPYLRLVAAAAGLVLLIACANLAGLLLVRARSREYAAAVRLSLGASPSRLARAALVETAIVCATGTAVALLVVSWGAAAIQSMLPPLFSRFASTTADLRVLGFSIGAAAFCAAAAGVLPAWRLARVDVTTVLQRAATAGRSRRVRGSAALLVVETAFGLLLVGGAAATARSLVQLMTTDVGFRAQGLYSISVTLPRQTDPSSGYQRASQVLDVLNQLAGVRSAAWSDPNPISGAAGYSADREKYPSIRLSRITSRFIDTLEAPVLAGRSLTDADVSSGRSVVVFSRSAASIVFPDARPDQIVGRVWLLNAVPAREVIGVVSDVRSGFAAETTPTVYVPASPDTFRNAMFSVRMADDAATPSLSLLRSQLRQAGLEPSSVGAGHVADRLDLGLRDQRFRAALFASFAITALFLAALGLYAVGSFDVTQRRREMGIRVALGAGSGRIQRLVVAQLLRPIAVGIAAGLLLSYWSGTLLQSFLHQVDARDPWTIAIVAVVLIVTAALAAWLPARRASLVDPVTTLRAQ